MFDYHYIIGGNVKIAKHVLVLRPIDSKRESAGIHKLRILMKLHVRVCLETSPDKYEYRPNQLIIKVTVAIQ